MAKRTAARARKKDEGQKTLKLFRVVYLTISGEWVEELIEALGTNRYGGVLELWDNAEPRQIRSFAPGAWRSCEQIGYGTQPASLAPREGDTADAQADQSSEAPSPPNEPHEEP